MFIMILMRYIQLDERSSIISRYLQALTFLKYISHISLVNFCHVTLFRIKLSLVAIPVSEHVSLSGEGPLLETLEFLSISQSNDELLNHGNY